MDAPARGRPKGRREAAAQPRSAAGEARGAGRLAIVSSVVAIATVISGVIFSTMNYRQSIRQFAASSQESHYNSIVTGLDSSAAAVQVNSMWLLREYVEDRSNYSGSAAAQSDGARDAIQTLAVFIEDNSIQPNREGLSYYSSPIPIIVSRAMDQLKALADDTSLGSHTADVSHGNMHGISLPYFHPAGTFLAVNADFRRASLSGMDLTAEPDDSLADSFFTCADLSGARFGDADVGATDFTGADLSRADLSNVRNLTVQQLTGATVQHTRFPKYLQPVTGTAWGTQGPQCRNLVNRMTGMEGGQGYVPWEPCPTTETAAMHLDTDPPFAGNQDDLVTACATRVTKRAPEAAGDPRR